jgi:hypothetical protein
MKLLPPFLMLALLTACAASKHDLAPPLAQALKQLASAGPIACTYEKTVTAAGQASQSAWHVWRSADRVETRDDLSRQGEIWQRDAGGRLFFTRLFYPERVALEYAPGDLAATGLTPSWEQVAAALLDPRQLGTSLRLAGKGQVAGLGVEHYAGTLDGVAAEVDWLPALGLPARVAKTFPERAVSLAIKDCAESPKAQAQPLSSQELDAYRHIDFSDLGDMESDPAVRRILELTGGHSHHHDGH